MSTFDLVYTLWTKELSKFTTFSVLGPKLAKIRYLPLVFLPQILTKSLHSKCYPAQSHKYYSAMYMFLDQKKYLSTPDLRKWYNNPYIFEITKYGNSLPHGLRSGIHPVCVHNLPNAIWFNFE